MPLSLFRFAFPWAVSLALLLALPAAGATLLIRDVTVVSPELTAPLTHQDVRIEAGRIVAIAPTRADHHAETELDGRGRFLTPGLIDSHVHLDTGTGLKRRYTQDFDTLYAGFQRQQPRSFLYHGFTTVVENNGDPAIDAQFEATPQHPRLIQCGPAAVLSNDFMATDFDSLADFHAAFPNYLHDRYNKGRLPTGADPAHHTPAAIVANIAASGGRCVKLYYEEALWWPGDHRLDFALPSEAIVREVVAEAHARNMTVLLHGTTPRAHQFGLATGIDVMAHGLWDWPGAIHGMPHIPDDVLATADAVAASPTRVQPTWMAAAGMVSLFKPNLLDEPGYTKVLPPDYIAYLRGPGQQARADYLQRFGPFLAAAHARGQAASADPSVIMDAYLQRYRGILQRQYKASARFLFGTDTAVGTPGWGNPPGLSGLWEMQAWAAAGIDPHTVLRAATIDNARAFGLADQIGSVEVGKRADLLLLARNPLLGVEAFNHIDKVILAGEVIERESLAADAPAPVGISSLNVAARANAPGFTATVWYPSRPGRVQRFGVSRIRPGYLAVADGEPALPERAPLIVLTHGTGGSAQSMAWLATALARRGAVVMAADHPASSGGDPERASMMQVWTQPHDVSQLLDSALASPWGRRIDPQRIASVGFSLGGATAMLLAGGRLDFKRFPEFCKTHDDGACRAFVGHFAHVDDSFYTRANADLSEPRLRAAVAIAPGFTEAFTAESLRAMHTPLLLLTGARDQQLPPQTHVHPMKHLLPASSQYWEIPDAHHFSFLPLCGPDAITLLAETQEEYVCQEFGKKSRAEIHSDSLKYIGRFLENHGVLRVIEK